MAKAILISLMLCMTTILYGQEIKLSFTPTVNYSVHNKYKSLGPDQKANLGFSASLDYLRITKNRLKLGLGLTYQNSQLEFSPNRNNPDMNHHNEVINFVSVRFRSVYNLKKKFYINVDPFASMDVNHNIHQIINDQTGLGLSLGCGKSIRLSTLFYLHVEPEVNFYNLIPFNRVEYPYRVITAGLNLGLAFVVN